MLQRVSDLKKKKGDEREGDHLILDVRDDAIRPSVQVGLDVCVEVRGT